jgi:hypothetical protein
LLHLQQKPVYVYIVLRKTLRKPPCGFVYIFIYFLCVVFKDLFRLKNKVKKTSTGGKIMALFIFLIIEHGLLYYSFDEGSKIKNSKKLFFLF